MLAQHRNNRKIQKSVSLARALSKLGYCSRAQANEVIHAARVMVNGTIQCNPAKRVDLNIERIEIDGKPIKPETMIYLMLNKPRGLVTTRIDEQGRETVFNCLTDRSLPKVFPVGRLDKASEGLLLFTNDSQWANRILMPGSHIDKVYHAQIDQIADTRMTQKMLSGVTTFEGSILNVKSIGILRQGHRNSWLEITLDEGRYRQIRRIFQAMEVNVLRLVRVAIGSLELGDLPKGHYRHLNPREIEHLAKRYLLKMNENSEVKGS